MKLFILGFVFFITAAAFAGEAIFIPGWLSENKNFFYKKKLEAYFPEDEITILSWDSAVSWKKAIANAEEFAVEIADYIAGKSVDEQKSILLIGHSLGGRIIVNTATVLAEKEIHVKQIFLLGAAIDFDTDLSAVEKVSNLPAVNIFSRNDSILKYLYAFAEHKFALGFCGAENINHKNLIQYNFSTSEPTLANTDSLTATREIINHEVENYLNELNAIISGTATPYKPMFDYSKIPPYGFIKTSIPPITGMKVLDSYADWTLTETEIKIKLPQWKKINPNGYKEFHKTVYVIYDHYGRIFKFSSSKQSMQEEFENVRNLIVKLN